MYSKPSSSLPYPTGDILIIEDDKKDAELLEKFFANRMSIKVEHIDRLENGYLKIEELHKGKKLECIVFDMFWKSPGGDERRAAKTIKLWKDKWAKSDIFSSLKDVPIIIVTEDADVANTSHLEDTCYWVINKPKQGTRDSDTNQDLLRFYETLELAIRSSCYLRELIKTQNTRHRVGRLIDRFRKRLYDASRPETANQEATREPYIELTGFWGFLAWMMTPSRLFLIAASIFLLIVAIIILQQVCGIDVQEILKQANK